MSKHKKKIEEAFPEIIKQISNSNPMSTDEIKEKHGGSSSSISLHMKALREQFYSDYIIPDKSTGKWVATETSFLEKMLIKPEEAVILTAMMRNKSTYGESLEPWVEKIVKNYVKRTKASVFKQNVLEKIDEDMEKLFAQIKYAIEQNKKVKFTYKNFDCYHKFYPYKIINLEYYWYLLGYEESHECEKGKSQIIKTFIMAKIHDFEILNEPFEYDFTQTEKQLIHTMNAFFQPDKEALIVELLVEKWLDDYIVRAPYFSGWKNTEMIQELDDIKYYIYEIKSTDHPYYRDIIPAILRYMPHIRVKDNETLVNAIFKHLENFASFHNKSISDN